MMVFSFESTIYILSLTGQFIREVLEKAVSEYSADGKSTAGQFLQVSGFWIVFDVIQDVGVVQVQTICKECNKDTYEDLDDDETYPIITTSYSANDGGDGPTSISDNKQD